MKTKLLILSYLLLPFSLFARTATALSDIASPGLWSDAATWSSGMVPANTDTVVIPGDKAVIINTVVYPSVSPPILTIQVRGVLRFEPPGKLHLASSASLHVFFGGSIIPKNGASSQLITIGGILKYNAANDGIISGPSYADILSGTSVAGSPLGGFMPWVLPVKWSDFFSRQTKEGTLLQWKVHEGSADHFQLEKSTDGGRQWHIIHEISAKGAASYSFVDRERSNDVVLYRVKAVSRNDQPFYSSIIKISAKSGVEMNVFPNPSTGSFQLTIPATVNRDLTASLINSTGQTVTRQRLVGSQNAFYFQLNGLAKGAYFIQLTEGGQLIGSQLMIIQ